MGAHSPLWGSKTRDANGSTIENFLDVCVCVCGLMCLNDGRPTRFNIQTGAVSCIDLALATSNLARVGEWDSFEQYTMGSEHFPILLRFGKALLTKDEHIPHYFDYGRADWKRFSKLCDESIDKIIEAEEGTLNEWNRLCEIVMNCAYMSIPIKKTPRERVCVPWWNKACDDAVRKRKSSLQSVEEISNTRQSNRVQDVKG